MAFESGSAGLVGAGAAAGEGDALPRGGALGAGAGDRGGGLRVAADFRLEGELVEPAGGAFDGLVRAGAGFEVAGASGDDRGVVVAAAVVEDGGVDRPD